MHYTFYRRVNGIDSKDRHVNVYEALFFEPLYGFGYSARLFFVVTAVLYPGKLDLRDV